MKLTSLTTARPLYVLMSWVVSRSCMEMKKPPWRVLPRRIRQDRKTPSGAIRGAIGVGGYLRRGSGGNQDGEEASRPVWITCVQRDSPQSQEVRLIASDNCFHCQQKGKDVRKTDWRHSDSV